MNVSEIKVDFKIEAWYLEYVNNCVDKLKDLERQGKITKEQAMDLAVDTIVLNIKHGLLVWERVATDGEDRVHHEGAGAWFLANEDEKE